MKNKNYSKMVAIFALVLAITTSLWSGLPATLCYAQGGYGGGGLPPAQPPAVTATGSVNLVHHLDAEGKTTGEIDLISTDGQVTMVIPEGTSIFDAQGNTYRGPIAITPLSTPPPPPGYTLVGPAYDCLPDGVTFVPAISLTFDYDPADIPTGVSEAHLVMGYWDGDQWVMLPTTVDHTADSATISVAHFTPFAILAKLPLAPAAAFSASSLNISPAEADIEETVTIGVLVTNTGELAGSYTVTLKIDEVVVATKEVTLDGGASQEVNFTTTKDVAGTYTVDVNGLIGEFAVTAPPPAPPPTNWGLIGGIIAAVIVVAVLAWYWVRRSRLIKAG